VIGAHLSHYLVLERLDAGGQGVVYRARDELLGREVAIKVLPAGALADEAGRKQFRKEALNLSKVNHPNRAPWNLSRLLNRETKTWVQHQDGSRCRSGTLRRAGASARLEVEQIRAASNRTLESTFAFPSKDE
jgi:serine/threonine protein kinase